VLLRDLAQALATLRGRSSDGGVERSLSGSRWGRCVCVARPGGEGKGMRGEDRRRGAAASPWFDRDGTGKREAHLSGEKIWAGDAAVGGDGTARKREPAGAGVR
jgi:hypothetical protein